MERTNNLDFEKLKVAFWGGLLRQELFTFTSDGITKVLQGSDAVKNLNEIINNTSVGAEVVVTRRSLIPGGYPVVLADVKKK